MNKKIVHIFLPVLALLFSVINCKPVYTAANSGTVSGYNISVAYQQEHSSSVNFDNKTTHKGKNAIRIKAWDDAAATIVTAMWVPVINISHYCKPLYYNYNSLTLSSHATFRQLRGPPVACLLS